MAVRVRAVCEAVSGAFTEQEFERVLLDLGVVLDDIAAPGAWPDRAYAVVLWAARHNRTAELIKAAQAANPGNAALAGLDTGQGNAPRGGVGTATHMSEYETGAEYGNGVQRKLGELSSDVAHLKDDFRVMRDDLTAIRGMLQGQGRGRETWGRETWWAAILFLAALVAVATFTALRLP